LYKGIFKTLIGDRDILVLNLNSRLLYEILGSRIRELSVDFDKFSDKISFLRALFDYFSKR